MSSILRTYRQNEAVNAHAENALLLAESYGTEAEVLTAREQLNWRDHHGYALPGASAFQAEIARRYLPLAKRDAAEAAAEELLAALRPFAYPQKTGFLSAKEFAEVPQVKAARAAIAKADGL